MPDMMIIVDSWKIHFVNNCFHPLFTQERHSEKRSEIPGAICSLYVNIIQHVMSSLSPDLTVLKAVCEFLLAIHPTKDTIHLDSPTGFYLAKNVRGYSTGKNLSSDERSGPVSNLQLPLTAMTTDSVCTVIASV